MGAVACQSDRYKEIQQHYGEEFRQFVVKEKIKSFLAREIGKVKKNVNGLVERNEKMYLKEIAEGEQQVDQYYQKIKKELNARQPGGIESLEQMTKTAVGDTLGYNYSKELFAQFKKQVQASLKEQESEIVEGLSKIIVEYQEELVEECPNLQLLGRLQQDEKNAILRRGELDFQNEIFKTQDYLLNLYGERMNFENFQYRLSSLDFRTQLMKLISISKDKMLTALNLVLSEQIGTYILIK